MSAVDENLATRVRDLEVTMWGARGDNGLRSEVRALKRAVEALPEKVRHEVDEAIEHLEGRDARSSGQSRWVIGLAITVVVMFLGSIMQTIATVIH